MCGRNPGNIESGVVFVEQFYWFLLTVRGGDEASSDFASKHATLCTHFIYNNKRIVIKWRKHSFLQFITHEVAHSTV